LKGRKNLLKEKMLIVVCLLSQTDACANKNTTLRQVGGTIIIINPNRKTGYFFVCCKKGIPNDYIFLSQFRTNFFPIGTSMANAQNNIYKTCATELLAYLD